MEEDREENTVYLNKKRLILLSLALLCLLAAIFFFLKSCGGKSGKAADETEPSGAETRALPGEPSDPVSPVLPENPYYAEILSALQSKAEDNLPATEVPVPETSEDGAPSGPAEPAAPAAPVISLQSGSAGGTPVKEETENALQAPREESGGTESTAEENTGREENDSEEKVPEEKKPEEKTPEKKTEETGSEEKMDPGTESESAKERPVSGWVLASQMPAGSEIVNEKWVYDLTESSSSAETELEGWTRVGESWVECGSGTLSRCEDVSSFNPSHWICASVGATENDMAGYETETQKRLTSERVFGGYVYYHWMYSTEEAAGPLIPSRWRGGNSEGRSCTRFYAFMGGDYPAASLNGETVYLVGDRTSNADTGGSFYWYRQPYYSCSYTDYRKEFAYERTTRDLESAAEITAGNGISNVRHYVQYK